MTVRAIYNIKMNRLILAPAGVVGSLSRLMQMNQNTALRKYLKAKHTVRTESALCSRNVAQSFGCVLVVIHLVDFSLQP